MWEGHRRKIRITDEISQGIEEERLEIREREGLLSCLCRKGIFKKEEMKLDDNKMIGDEDRQYPPIVEREFETDDKGRTMVVCVLCGEVRAYKTKGEGRCCVRTTHKWRPIAKTNRDDGGQ